MPPIHMTNNTSGVINFVACIAYRVSVEDPPGKGRSVSEIYYVLDISAYSFWFISGTVSILRGPGMSSMLHVTYDVLQSRRVRLGR